MYKWQSLNKKCILILISCLTIVTVAFVALYQQVNFSDPHSSYELVHMDQGPTLQPVAYLRDEKFRLIEGNLVAHKLHKDIRILCWIMTGPKNHEKRAKHIKNTWGKRCNVLLFMSSIQDPFLPSVGLPVKEGRNHLWRKTKEAFKYIYKHYLDKADWFLKADDDTYVILENLRYMLMSYNTNESIYFGCRFKPFVKQGYMSGGAGYVLSKEALKRFVEFGLTNLTGCSKKDSGYEDVEMGRCLEAVNVTAGDSRDSLGRGRFFPFPPQDYLILGPKSKSFWYWGYIYYKHEKGMECCSDSAVSFHYIPPTEMYLLEYLIYHLKPYGISFRVESSHQVKDTKYINLLDT